MALSLLPNNTVTMAVAAGEAADAQSAPTLGSTCMEAPPPLLVQVLGGNVVTTAAVLACLNTIDATVLRRLHPALAAAVAAVPWADITIPVRNIARWRAALPAAVALKPTANALFLLQRGEELAVLEVVTALDLAGCISVSDVIIAHLPPTLRVLNVSACKGMTQHVRFAHLPALVWLDCSGTGALATGLTRLPPSLLELRMHDCKLPATANFSHLCNLRVVACGNCCALSNATVASLPPSLEVFDLRNTHDYDTSRWSSDWSLAHLTRLRMLKASHSSIASATLATLPPSLQILDLEGCNMRPCAASFAHLAVLHTLSLHKSDINTLATLPPSLVSLDLHGTTHSDREMLTPAAVFPALPSLQVLNVSHTGIGDAAVASLPASLEELHMMCCYNVTQRASLGHMAVLRVLQSVDTDLLPATIVACRARGCFAPADGKLEFNGGMPVVVTCMAPLPDGRLVSGACSNVVLREAAAGRGTVVAELELPGDQHVRALAVLRDGHRVAISLGNAQCTKSFGIVVWDTGTREAPHAVSHTTITCDSIVWSLAVAHNGWLVAGCQDGTLRVVDVDAGVEVAKLEAHDGGPVTAVVVLPDGRVASAASDSKVRLWDLDKGTCDSTLVGHTGVITSLAVLPDGRLASGSWDKTVRLWDTSSGTCLRVLSGHTDTVETLAVLPGDRLASLSYDGTIRVWDTRNDAGGAGGALLARPPLIIEHGPNSRTRVLLPLPNNRLVTGYLTGLYLWQLPPPCAT